MCNTSMIGRCIESGILEFYSKIFGILAAKAVNNSAFILPLIHKRQDLSEFFGSRPYLETQVFSVKGSYVLFGMWNIQLLANIFPGGFVCRSSKRNHWSGREAVLQVTQLRVGRPEIMSPAGNTMGFIYCNEANVSGGKNSIYVLQAFRGNV